MQLTGRMFDEAEVLRIADAYERDTLWWKKEPPHVRFQLGFSD
jgi:Asp-tRNA(Asn)/Glu-tRNA(Gln) amidotransferase A subunit family amidase